MKLKLMGAGFLLALLAYKSQASASIVTATYTGTVSFDQSYTYSQISGFSPSIYNQYLGDTMTLSFQVNTALGTALALPPGATALVGGTQFGGGTLPVYDAVAKLGSQTFSIGSNEVSEVVQTSDFSGNGPGQDAIAHEAEGFTTTYNADTGYTSTVQNAAVGEVVNFNGLPSFVTTNPAALLNYNVQSGDSVLGEMILDSFVDDQFGNRISENYEEVSFNPTNVAVTLTSGVPEPATWAMMLIGFAGVGVAGMHLRRGAEKAVA